MRWIIGRRDAYRRRVDSRAVCQAEASGSQKPGPSRPAARRFWPHVKDQRAADKRETEVRRHQRHQHRRSKDHQNRQRSASRHTPRARRYLTGVRAGQHLALKNVVGNVDAHEQPRVKHYRGRREPGARNPCGRKEQERHREEVDLYSLCASACDWHSSVPASKSTDDSITPHSSSLRHTRFRSSIRLLPLVSQ
jgi:hypothetical protein